MTTQDIQEGATPQESKGMQLIVAERRRQIEEEGYTADRDSWCSAGELAKAALAYSKAAKHEQDTGDVMLNPPDIWPWAVDWWKPQGGVVRLFVKAGALHQAQYDWCERCGATGEMFISQQSVEAVADKIDMALARDREERYQTIKVPVSEIPKGAKLVEAYETERAFVILSNEPDLPADHNCDALGCTTFSHVLARFEKVGALGEAALPAGTNAQAQGGLTPEYSYSYDEENYSGSFDSVADALEEAFNENDEAEVVFIGENVAPGAAESYVDADLLIEHVTNQDDYCHEWAEGWPRVSKEQEAEMTAEVQRVFGAWLDKHELRPWFWLVENTKEYSREEWEKTQQG